MHILSITDQDHDAGANEHALTRKTQHSGRNAFPLARQRPSATPLCTGVKPAPQNSIRKNAGTRAYAPACKIRSHQTKLAVAAAPGPVQFYGTLTAPSLLARKTLTFASFLRERQVRDWVLAQNDSDAVAMMDDILRDRACDKSPKDTRAYLKRLCRQRAAEKHQPIRYWQRVKNSLLHPYLGMLGGRAWNSKAEKGEVIRLDRHAAYRARERDRLAARRCVDGRAQGLKRRIARLRRQANSFDLKARAKVEKADRLLAVAKLFEAKAEQKRASAAKLSRSLKSSKKEPRHSPLAVPLRNNCRT